MTCACGRPITRWWHWILFWLPFWPRPKVWWTCLPGPDRRICDKCHELELTCTGCGFRFVRESRRTVHIKEDGVIEFLCDSCNERRTP